jgi:ribonuclease T2
VNRRTDVPRLRAFAASLGAAALLLSGCEEASDETARTPPAAAAPAAVPIGSGFDFYVLALSWSPSYCEAEGAEANQQQCKAARPYAFVVHGLWPQFERGFPQDCPTETPQIGNETLRGLYDLMPSGGLIRHEWKSHGTCSGLSQSDYFAVLRMARDKVTIPETFRRVDDYLSIDPQEAEKDFLTANAGLPADGIAVTCDKRFLREVRICMSKDLTFRPCPQIDRRACRLEKAVMPPARNSE